MSGLSENTQSLVALVDQFIASRNITHQQYRVLSKLVLADGNIDEQELQQINRLFDAIQAGMIRVVE
ncbi:hypothetical protein PN498_11385 [Oscillatoria sp. CS-180]|uniref:hypothetical protein n=1 Tax=Oscillatoria sp. CS-180 TaxID=3021720 RepID=UPI00232D730B|nr:hypothetical protein [Oscillatoria sp. CS-180]MDB9526595.1 hypothetical protein [Oscillatoria sp. CS-180]